MLTNRMRCKLYILFTVAVLILPTQVLGQGIGVGVGGDPGPGFGTFGYPFPGAPCAERAGWTTALSADLAPFCMPHPGYLCAIAEHGAETQLYISFVQFYLSFYQPICSFLGGTPSFSTEINSTAVTFYSADPGAKSMCPIYAPYGNCNAFWTLTACCADNSIGLSSPLPDDQGPELEPTAGVDR